MGTAYEIRTAQHPGVIRKAYRLDPPFVAPTYDDEGESITATTEYVVLSNNRDEVMAFPGVYRRIFGVETVTISDMREVGVIKGLHRTRRLLTEMGYETVIDLAGRTTVITPKGQ